MDTTNDSPVEDNSCHSTRNLLASSPDSGIPQSSPHTPLSFQLVSRLHLVLCLAFLVLIPITFSQLVLALLHAQERQKRYEMFLAGDTESHTSNFSLIFDSIFLPLSLPITKTTRKARQVIPNESYAVQRICNFILSSI